MIHTPSSRETYNTIVCIILCIPPAAVVNSTLTGFSKMEQQIKGVARICCPYLLYVQQYRYVCVREFIFPNTWIDVRPYCCCSFVCAPLYSSIPVYTLPYTLYCCKYHDIAYHRLLFLIRQARQGGARCLVVVCLLFLLVWWWSLRSSLSPRPGTVRSALYNGARNDIINYSYIYSYFCM